MSAELEAGYRSRLVQAASALKALQSQLDELRQASREPIAVIGMGCRFPGGADDLERFWQLLAGGVDAVSEVPPERAALHGDPGQEGDQRWGAFLDGVEMFDAEFFGISPREAAALDPQQRLLLEVAWEALEHAGVVPGRLRDSATGVFAGMSSADYLMLSMAAAEYDAYTGTGGTHCFGPGRLSYHLGLRGPSLAVDTACSSSLVAVHLAVRSLRSGESSLALAGGVSLTLVPAATRLVAQLDALSPDGRCRAFDARANGFVRGEGCGLVVLKRLADAVADGDRVHAVIRGTAVNQDGASSGLTAPNPLAQRDLLRQALADAGVEAAELSHVETHGTGTALGDPIEIEALTAVLGEPGGDGDRCTLGAVKTNIGHLEAAAGIAGLIKTVLALRHETVPANLHFTTLNPRIALDRTRFVIPDRPLPWPSGPDTRVAGVSSFGMSGTNAHAILAEAPAPAQTDRPPQGPDPVLVALSARSAPALPELARAHAAFLRASPDATPRDVAYTAGERRSHHRHRLAVVGSSREELASSLDALAAGQPGPGSSQGRATDPPPLAFVFSGQGSQWIGMGCGLLAQEPVFADALAACDAALARHAPFSIAEQLAAAEPDSRLHDTEITQPALFAVQVALSALLASWGVEPGAVIGHSVGEIAAAHVAGALSLDDAAGLVTARGRIMRRAAGSGGMVAVGLPAEEAERALVDHHERVSVAAINDPGTVVLAGPAASLGDVTARLRSQGVYCRALSSDYAFHSRAMAPLAEELAGALDGMAPRATAVPMYSTVTGDRIDGVALDGSYWARNVRRPVLFAQAALSAIDAHHTAFLEVGPHPVLSGNVRECLAGRGVDGFAVPTLRRARPERTSLLGALGALYTRGYRVDFARVHAPGGRVVSLPAYPWQRRRHWIGGGAARRPAAGTRAADRDREAARPDTGLARVDDAPAFGAVLSADSPAVAGGRWIAGQFVVPETLVVEWCRFAVAEVVGSAPVRLAALTFAEPLVLPRAGARSVLVTVDAEAGGAPVAALGRAAGAGHDEGWTAYAGGHARPSSGDAEAEERRLDLDGLRDLCRAGGAALARVQPLAGDAHAGLLDATVRAILDAAGAEPSDGAPEYRLAAIAELTAWEPPTSGLWVHARARRGPGQPGLCADVTILACGGEVLAEWRGAELRPLDTARLRTLASARWVAELWPLSAQDRSARVRAAVRADVATVLQLLSPDDIPADRLLQELGMDSLMAVQVRHELAARTGRDLPATVAFDHPTVDAISNYLLDTLGEPAAARDPAGRD